MRTKIKQLAYLCGGLFLSLALAGFVAAQTTGGTGGTVMMCPNGTSVPAGGTCPTTSGTNTGGTGTTSSMTTCPNGTQVPVGTACPSTMTTCPNGTQVPAGSTCPSTMTTCPDGTQVPSGTTCPTQESKCTSANGKWCKNSDGATGWCSYSSSPCPAYDEPSCKAQSGDWCKYTSGTGGYCATNGAKCPINDEATCVAKGRPWCKSAGGVATISSGWCGEIGYKCPANDEASCKAQGSQWCTSAGGTATSGWCQTSGDCPVNDSATCAAKARTWCPYTSGSGGWCATSGYNCNGVATGGTTTQTSSTSQYTCANGTQVSNISQCTSSTTTYTCSDGSKVSDSSKCPATQTTYMSWPQSQAECTKYKGVWCPPATMGGSSTTPTYSGSCMMAGQICPKSSTANMMTCWDNTQVPLSSSCPSTPTNSSDCSVKGGQWCASTATGGTATAGWCTSKGNGCPKYPPSGQMTCPDNQTYASKLTDCPSVSTTEDITYKTCSDGTLVKKDVECPKKVNYIICSDGSKVVEGTACPTGKDNADMTACLAKNAIWCVDKNSGKSGYCSTTGSCQVNSDDQKKKNDQEEKQGLSAKEVKQLEQAKKSLLNKLNTLEKFFTKVKDAESLAKVIALKGQINALTQDQTAFDSLELISDDIDALKEIKDATVNNGVDTQSEQDQALQKKALKQLKSSVAKFAGQLTVIQGRITRLEHGGAAIPSDIKDLVSKAQNLVKQVQSAASFDEARDAAESLRDIAENLGEALATLEQLTRVQELSATINKEISRRETDFKRVRALATKFKIDVDAYLDEVGSLLQAVRESFNKIKSGEFGDSEPIDFVQAQIIDKLDDIDVKIANLQSLTNLKGSIKQVGGQIVKFDTQIKRLEKKKKDVTDMKSALADLKVHYTKLQSFAKQKITEDNLSEIVDELSAAAELSEQLNDLLQINAPSALERELKKGLNASSLKGIDIPSLETSLLRAYRVAIFARRTPAETAAFLTIGGYRKVNTVRGSFVQDR